MGLFTKFNWKRAIWPALITVLGLILLFGQFRWQWFNFASNESSRLYIILCIAIVSVGHAATKNDWGSRIGSFLLIFIPSLVILMAIGGWAQLNDMTNGTDINEGKGLWMAFDVISSPFTSKAIEFSIIVQTIIGTVPAIVLLFSIISIWTSDSPDEQQSALLEFAMVLGVMIVFSFFADLFGFSWV